MSTRTGNRIKGAVGEALAHDSGRLHVSGRAWYTDDIPEPKRVLHAAVGMSTCAHGRIKTMDLDPVRESPGVAAVYTAADIPGENNFGPVVHDDPILADGSVQYAGQALFVVAAETVDQARRAARRANVEYQAQHPVLDLDEAVKKESFVLPSQKVARGDTDAALGRAGHRLSGRLELGGQDQFYLEGQIAMAVPKEDGDMHVYSSTQHPGEVQHLGRHWPAGQGRGGGMPAHGRRLRRQGKPGRAHGLHRRPAGAAHGPCGQVSHGPR